MDNQVSGFWPPVSPYNYILHSLITSVNRLYGYEQLLWALLSHSVKAELVVVKELLDSVSGPAACGRNGIFFSWEDVWNSGLPSTWVCSWNWPFRNLCSAFRWRTFAQVIEGFILSGWWRYQMFPDVHVSSWSILTQCRSYLWITKVERRQTLKMYFVVQLLLNICHFKDYLNSLEKGRSCF